MKKFIHFICIALMMMPVMAAAQASQNKDQGTSTYKTGIGLRGGSYTSGLTFKTFIKDDAAIEGILSVPYFRNSFLITVLYEKHATAFNTEGFKWFYGLGGHIGSYHYRHYYSYYNCNKKKCIRINEYDNHNRFVSIGIDGILGLEYKIQEIPFTLGVDIKPYIDIVRPGLGYFDSAFSVRYVFGGN